MSLKDWLIKKCGGYTNYEMDMAKLDADFWQNVAK